MYFQKAIFIYTSIRGGLGKNKKKKKEKRSFLFSGLFLILEEPLKCSVTEVSFGTSDYFGMMEGI